MTITTTHNETKLMDVNIPIGTNFNAEKSTEVKESKPNSNKDNILVRDLLKKVKEVDFYKYGEIDQGKKLNQKHFLILVVDYALEQIERGELNIGKYNDSIYFYNGQYWIHQELEFIKTFLSKLALNMGVDKYTSDHFKFAENLLKQFLFKAKIQQPLSSINKVHINLRNGTFEVERKGFRLKEFDSADFLTYQLNFSYSPSAKCPKFKAYLNKVLPDKASQEILSEYIGYVFTKNLKLEKCLLLYGGGGNGKSVFFDIVDALLGEENISNYTLESLGSEQNRAELGNKLLNYGSEIEGNISNDLFKRLASGEPIDARYLFGRPFIIRHYAKLMFNANELPKGVEHSEAYFRRFLIIPFDVTIPKHERNGDLAKEIIQEELAGVFNWVLEGLQRLLESKRFTESEKVNKQIDLYKKESNNVYLFMVDGHYKTSIKEEHSNLLTWFYSEYRRFCHEGGYSPLNRKHFRDRLIKLGYEVKRQTNGVNVFFEK